MEATIKLKDIARKLSSLDDFIISGHIRADGDAIAAVCYMGAVCKRLGKRYMIRLDDREADEKYNYLECFENIHSIHDTDLEFPPKVAILLDTPTNERLGHISTILKDCETVINIDHHISNTGFGGVDYIDVSASSTCEILARLEQFLPIENDSNMAQILYTGILFDTGQFRFSNTGSETLRTAGHLIEQGADPEFVSDRIFYNWSKLRVHVMGIVLQSIRLFHNNRIGIFHIPHKFFADNPAGWKELEGFSDLAVSMKDVKVSAFLKEIEPGKFKASLRATENFDVGSVAGEFGGGGHSKAAGCDISGDLKSVSNTLIELFQKINPEL